MNEKQYHYSKIQYIFWLISGSEISILKTCPTDYNRHAGIGFTIFMTSLFGAFAGGYAGYYFTKGSLIGATVFGIICGLLIFSIDRTMVVSLKKKPTDKPKSFIVQIIARAVLAALIAFIISIPLELLIFNDNIDAGLSFDKVNQQLQLQKNLDSLNNPKGDSAILKIEESKAVKFDQLSKTDPTDQQFKILIDDLNQYNSQKLILQGRLSQVKNKATSFLALATFQDIDGRNKIDKATEAYENYTKYRKLQGQLNNEIKVLKEPMDTLVSKIDRRRKDWEISNQNKSREASVMAELKQDEILKESRSMDSTRQIYDTALAKIDQSFVVRFDVLTFLANKKNVFGEREFASILFLLWLIRILFFTIEILPTIVKVFTPFGMYDTAVFNMEEDFKNIKIPAATMMLQEKLLIDNTKENDERKRQMEYRLKKEGALHDKLVNEISEAQDKIARRILSDWISKNS